MDWIGHLVLGPLILALALFFKFYKPKKINHLYGYRTARSMKSKESWEEGNRYSSNLMILAAVLTCITQIITQYTIKGEWMFLVPVIVMCVLLVAIIPLTEIHLKKLFDKEGKPLSNSSNN